MNPKFKAFSVCVHCSHEAIVIMIGTMAEDQDQDSLLVKRRNDNHSPGLVIREINP